MLSKSTRICSTAYRPYSTANVKCPVPPAAAQKTVQKVAFTEEDYNRAKPYESIPGPTTFEFIKNFVLPWGKLNGKDFVQVFKILQQEHGNLFKMPGGLGRAPTIVVCDPNEAEVIFRNEGPTPFRRGLEISNIFRRQERADYFGERAGLIQDQGWIWQDTRTKVNPILMNPKTVKKYIGTIDAITGDFLRRIREIRSNNNNEMPSNFQFEMNKWALESVSYIALNRRIGLFEQHSSTGSKLKGEELIEAVQTFINLSFKMEVLPSIWRIVKTPDYKRIMKALHTMTNIITEFIDEAIKDLEDNPAGSDGNEGVLQQLLKIDKKVAIVMALDMMIAGVDTTSNTTAFLLYALATNPEKQNLLREEIMTIMPEKDTPLTEQSMKNLPYLRACMKESTRVRGTVIGTARRLPVDIVVSGYQLPKNTDIAMAANITSMSEEYFKDHNEFIPERFLRSGSCPELKAQHPFAFMPFGFGPRMCVGRRLAELEMEILTCKLIRNFEIKWSHKPMKVKNELINSLDGPLKFQMVDIQ